MLCGRVSGSGERGEQGPAHSWGEVGQRMDLPGKAEQWRGVDRGLTQGTEGREGGQGTKGNGVGEG